MNNILTWKSAIPTKWKNKLQPHLDEWFLSKTNKQEYLEEYNIEFADYLKILKWEESDIADIFAKKIESIHLTNDKKRQELLRKELFTDENIQSLNKFTETKSLVILKAFLSWENKALII